MLSVTQNGDITKWITGEGNIKLSLDEVNEKELLLVIASKLHSIRGMMLFFVFLTIIGLISMIASIASR